ncbi:MAG: hypothetical protein RLZZ26_399 [Candidatus Parcubacteria bacterium]|jgi:protein-S-isoprenylcysteine O-methyltransferase Ste14
MHKQRLYNLLGAVPLLVWYAWGLAERLLLFIQHGSTLIGSTQVHILLALQVVTHATSIAFTSLIIVLLIVRSVPRTHVQGVGPYAAAYIGTFATITLFHLPSANLSTTPLIVATLCVVVGLGLSLYALIYLGRSFAILPSARTLVTDGPYRVVRHPLYLFEEVAVVGIMIQFAQPWSLIVFTVHLAAQITRMHYEERALTQAFPEYAVYASRTARLIPGIY